MRGARKDLAAIRAAYLAGEGTLAELARGFGVPINSVRKRAHKEKWRRERERLFAEASRRADVKLVESLAEMFERQKTIHFTVLGRAESMLAAKKLRPGQLLALAQAAGIATRFERLCAGVEPEKPVPLEDARPDAEVVIERAKPEEPASADE